MIRFRTTALFAATAAAAAVAASASSAEAATTCTFANGVIEVHMSEHGDAVSFDVTGGRIGVTRRRATVACPGGTPRTTTTDTVLIVDDSDNPATAAPGDGDTTVSIVDPGKFGPGKNDEPPPGSGEIEFLVDTKAGDDLLDVSGDDAQTITVGNDGLSWTTDADADVQGMPFDMVRLFGSRRADALSARGGDGTGAPLTTARHLHIDGSDGDDVVVGSDIAGGDTLIGEDDRDLVWGGAGDDKVIGGSGNDAIVGGAGSDTLHFINGTGATVDLTRPASQNTGEGNDILAEIENVHGTAGPDRLLGDAGVNMLEGNGGDDTLEGRGGADEIHGGGGVDAVSYSQAAAPVTVDLARTTQPTDGDGLNSIENVVGSPFADVLSGNDVANRVVGGAGADTIASGAGADRVEIRDGEGDRVSCGADADTAIGDRRTLDVLDADCESVDALPEATPPEQRPIEPAQPSELPTEPSQPGERPVDPGARDTTLTFALRGAGRQRVLRQKAVHVSVGCPLESCTVEAGGAGRLRATAGRGARATRLELEARPADVAAGVTRTLKLRLTRRQLAALRTAIGAGQRPTITVTVRARDGAGNAVRRTLRVKVRR